MKTLTQLTRNELLDIARKNEVPFENNVSKSDLLTALIAKLGPEFSVEEQKQPETPMKARILELAAEKLTTAQIERKMKAEGYHRIRQGYIYTILRDKGLTLPKEERVTISKDEYAQLLALKEKAGKK